MNISIISYGFTSWGGGIDFIRHIATSLMLANENKCNPDCLILPRKDTLSYIKKSAHPFKCAIQMLLNGQVPSWQQWKVFDEIYFKETFSDLTDNIDLAFSGSNLSSQFSMAHAKAADVVLPCIKPPSREVKLPWVGYIYDFQHRHLPDFFTANERARRDKDFTEMLHRASHVIVNARSVIEDSQRFIKDHPATIHSLPFSPCPQQAWLTSNQDVREQYGIDRPYFLICNQFWKHKDHITAFRGFANYVHQGGEGLLVCTGATEDYRFPGYFSELQKLIFDLGMQEKIVILGHIPKTHQISLVKHTLAMVQATLFEGGPGGGAAYDAIALGIPVIASNIPVNLEMDCGDVRFFEARNPDQLCQKLMERVQQTIAPIPHDQLWKQGQLRKRRCGEFLINVANQAINDFQKVKQ